MVSRSLRELLLEWSREATRVISCVTADLTITTFGDSGLLILSTLSFWVNTLVIFKCYHLLSYLLQKNSFFVQDYSNNQIKFNIFRYHFVSQHNYKLSTSVNYVSTIYKVKSVVFTTFSQKEYNKPIDLVKLNGFHRFKLCNYFQSDCQLSIFLHLLSYKIWRRKEMSNLIKATKLSLHVYVLTAYFSS